jgi:hypothetical protein
MAAMFWDADLFDRLSLPYFLMVAAVPIVVLVALAVKTIYSLPKCPHCGIRLVGPLLVAAVASGNCGHCGRSVVDVP